MQESHENILGKRSISNQSEPPLKKQKTTSLLELCSNEEWNVIIESAQDMMKVWDFEEKNNDGNNPLHICCAKGALKVLQHFQQLQHFDFNKFPNNKEGDSCILLAAKNGHLETLKWLIDNGCSIYEKNHDDETCSLIASRYGQLEILKWLLRNGCTMDATNYSGNTCLLMAAEYGQLETFKWLLENGSSLHEGDEQEYSCFLLAAKSGNIELVKWLIEMGCSIHEKNAHGESTLIMAAWNGKLELV